MNRTTLINFFKRNLYSIIAVGMAGLGAVTIFSFWLSDTEQLDWSLQVYHEGTHQARRLDGQIVHLTRTNLKPIAVIIENHVDSRPVAGLDQASVIYEVVVEGEITRFLAFFDGNFEAKKIGPVRSVRPFFVDIVEEWNPVLFHAGGSVEGLQQIRQSPVYNINEISSDGIYFWRDNTRDMPHNLFTSSDLIKRALVTKDLDQPGDFSPWLFKVDNPINFSGADSNFEVVFSSGGSDDYNVAYQYNPSSNDYNRLINTRSHKTDKGIILKAKNVVIQKVDAEIVDSYGRLEINLSGQGQATVYQDGKRLDGQWKKLSGRTRFYNLDGKEIKFNRGTVWVEIVFN